MKETKLTLPDDPQIIIMVGKPKSGKSFNIKGVIHEYAVRKKLWKFGLVICKTKFTGCYDFLPDKWVWPEYDEEKLDRYMTGMQEKASKLPKGQKLPPNFIILDDCMGQIDMYSKFFTNFVATYRHTNTWVILTAQSLKGKGTSTQLRECTDLCFMYRTHFEDAIEGLYKAYGGIFPSKAKFKEAFEKATEKEYHCLLFRNNQETKNDAYLIHCAPKVPEFRLKY